jgi:hypothetical protein
MGEPKPGDIEGHLAMTETAIERGAYVTCDALEPTASAVRVRVREGEVLRTDGPFAESKEVLGGFYVLDCKDMDEAISFAAMIPPARTGAIEVRRVATIPGWDDAVAAMQARVGGAAR